MISKKLEVSVQRKDILLSNGKSFQLLDNNYFDIAEGEFVSILGKSGCGKTTLLNIIAGLDRSYEGEILLDGLPSKQPSLNKGVIFQNPRLLPWLSVKKNLEFALPKRHKLKLQKHIHDLISLVGLSGCENSLPIHLSGGMAQRVALARALVNLPTLLLLDEPLGSLDSQTRMLMQNELHRILQEEKVTALMVTHDIDEAVFLSDRILIMGNHPGSIQTEIKINLPKPRDRISDEFLNLRSRIYKEFIQIVEYN